MLARRLAPLMVVLGAVGLAAGCADQSAAVRVGDQTLSEADFVDELQAVAGNQAYVDAFEQATGQAVRGDSAASFSQGFVGGILEQRVVFMLVAKVFEDQGLEVTDDERMAAESQVRQDPSLGGFYDGFPESYQRQLLDDYARVIELQNTMGQDEFSGALRDAAESTDIQVSSRYGSFDLDAMLNGDPAIVAPPGPAPAPDESGDAAPGDAGPDAADTP